ncbi:hypothetical protein [Microbacterium sp. Marseille-Q6965]|uniref:hypothetical protein n=1 Tax=Microbacterium sp. Marseille-Q6965 TaxID=2965072 RepID=UPI0021B7488D|nr:hypothetical protein [Microbacterium sp. Marseille-Q6965]
MKVIWATRGRDWGFRFLDDGGFADPLPEYDAVFSAAGSGRETCQRVGDRVALRFADPEGRVDSAGRVIPHEFVVFPPDADDIRTLDDALRLVWAPVAEDYAARYAC